MLSLEIGSHSARNDSHSGSGFINRKDSGASVQSQSNLNGSTVKLPLKLLSGRESHSASLCSDNAMSGHGTGRGKGGSSTARSAVLGQSLNLLNSSGGGASGSGGGNSMLNR